VSRVLFRVIIVAVLVTALLLLLQPPQRGAGEPLLPWQVAADGHGGSRVFGIRLGETTLGEAETALGGDAKMTLFQAKDGRLVVEAFLQKRTLRGLKADFVLGVVMPRDTLEAMYRDGLRIAKGRADTRRVTLDPDGAAAARAASVISITYLPTIELDSGLLEKRFGVPAGRIAERDGVVHWLYPDKGLDIVVNDDGKEVLQYVAPRDFERLAAPLRDGSGSIK